MPNSKSPEKRLRQEKTRAKRNHYVKRTLFTLDKKMRSETVSLEEKQELIKVVFSKLDKAAKTGVIHKRTASRRKSRLAAVLAKEYNVEVQ